MDLGKRDNEQRQTDPIRFELLLRLEEDFRICLEPIHKTLLQAGPFLFLRRYAGAKLTDAATLLGLRHPAVTVGPETSGDCRVIYDRPIPFRFPLALVLSIVCLVLPAWADFETAMDAYNHKDYATALREWQALAEQGEADAQDFLGTLHFKGWGVPQDYTKARQWWEKAAAQGSASAQSDLGQLYASGLGGSQDLVQAYMWYSLAAGNGYEIATGYRNDLAKQMTPGQITEAQQLAREWKPLKK